MPSEHVATNVGGPLVAGDLVELLPEDLPPAPPPVDYRICSTSGRPWGIAKAAIIAGADGTIYLNGARSGFLAPGESVAAGDRLVSAGSGNVKKAPAGYTGWIAGVALEAKTAGMTRVALSLRLAPRVV